MRPEHGVPEGHVVYEPLDLALHPPVPELHLAQLVRTHDRMTLTGDRFDVNILDYTLVGTVHLVGCCFPTHLWLNVSSQSLSRGPRAVLPETYTVRSWKEENSTEQFSLLVLTSSAT